MITILTATYNSSKTLRACLDSLITQSYQDWECILCDGCSTDDTIKIAKEYEAKDKRISHHIKKDHGIYEALNNGIPYAKGDWIYVLGSDDRITPDGFTNLLAENNGNYDAMYGNIIVDYDNGTQREIKPKPLSSVKYYMPISHQGVIFKTKLVREIGGFDLRYKVKGDFNMTLTAYMRGCKFHYVDTPIAYCGVNGLSNQLWALIKFDKERLQITRRNHSNHFPLLFWSIIELRTVLIELRDRLMKRK